jgi:hypothetical protein
MDSPSKLAGCHNAFITTICLDALVPVFLVATLPAGPALPGQQVKPAPGPVDSSSRCAPVILSDAFDHSTPRKDGRNPRLFARFSSHFTGILNHSHRLQRRIPPLTTGPGENLITVTSETVGEGAANLVN